MVNGSLERLEELLRNNERKKRLFLVEYRGVAVPENYYSEIPEYHMYHRIKVRKRKRK